MIVRLHFLCINCWIKRVVEKKWSSWKDSRRSPLRIVGGADVLTVQYSRGRLDPTIKNNCHIGHRKKIEPPTPKCNVSSRPSWSTTGYFGIIMHKRSIKRNTLYKLQRKKEGKWCLQVYAHHILVFSPLNCHMRSEERRVGKECA